MVFERYTPTDGKLFRFGIRLNMSVPEMVKPYTYSRMEEVSECLSVRKRKKKYGHLRLSRWIVVTFGLQFALILSLLSHTHTHASTIHIY